MPERSTNENRFYISHARWAALFVRQNMPERGRVSKGEVAMIQGGMAHG
jgi:hypothetical protein